jgi:hypothetical protein
MISRFVLAIATTLALLSQAPAAFDPKRIVTNVDHAAKTFSCQAAARGEPSYTYKITTKTVVRISGKRPRQSRGTFSQIKVGEIITVEYHLEGAHRVAQTIVIHDKK